MEQVFFGILSAFQFTNLLFVAAGVAIGIGIGAIPGLAPPLAIAVAIPLTFSVSPLAAIGMLIGVMKGSGFGGAISATLLNTPGTAAAVATTLDGYPLAQKGKPRKALKMALYSSVFGDTCSDMVLILVSVPIAAVALKMGPIEIASLLTISISLIASLAGESVTKSLLAAFLGLLLTTIGMDPETASPRMTFDLLELYNGLPISAVAIGMLAIAEVFIQLEKSREKSASDVLIEELSGAENKRVSFKEFWACRKTLARGALFGTGIGALPGLGAALAAFMSYAAARQASDKPDEFGTGKLEGIAATESANSAVVGANLIPLLTLGIPGNVAAALLIGAFTIHGIQPGPLLFTNRPNLVYGLFASMIMANVMNLTLGNIGLRVFAKVVSLPRQIIYPSIVILCISGVYLAEGSLFAVGVMIAMGVLGYLMRKLGLSIVCFIIGYVLGPMIELTYRQSILLLRYNPSAIFQHPFALLMFVATPIVIWRIMASNKKKQRQ